MLYKLQAPSSVQLGAEHQDGSLFSCETWTITGTLNRKLDVFDMRCLRRILRISYRDHISNLTIRRGTATTPADAQNAFFSDKLHGSQRTSHDILSNEMFIMIIISIATNDCRVNNYMISTVDDCRAVFLVVLCIM